jgi:hypothetical protein
LFAPVAFAFSAWFTPWYLFAPTLAFALLLGVLDRRNVVRLPSRQDNDRTSRGGNGARRKRRIGVGAIILSTGLVIYAVTATLLTMWLPHERLVVKGMKTPVVGYVVEESGGWMTVLTSGDRKVARLKEELVDSRTVCRASDFHESPIQWLARHAGERVAYVVPCKDPAVVK